MEADSTQFAGSFAGAARLMVKLTHLQQFEYSVDAPLAGPLPSSWSKLENIFEISIYDGYDLLRRCQKPAMLHHLLTCWERHEAWHSLLYL